jgi:hypothetical protein
MLDISVRTDKVGRRNIRCKLSIHSKTGLFDRFIEMLNEGGRKYHNGSSLDHRHPAGFVFEKMAP